MVFMEVRNLVKDYSVNVRKKGFWGAFQSLLIPEYKTIRAVNDISFQIDAGEMVGFIGPNGAGKSTTVKMLTGILTPTSGTISIGGLSPFKDRKKNVARIGAVFGQRTQLWLDLPVIDTFELLKHIYRISETTYRQNLEMFCDLLGLNDFLHQAVRQLSLGQRMRADIAAAMLHNPEVIFFDEPTIGLDVVVKEKIREFIKQVNQQRHTTMLFTTHDMADIEKTCQRMLIIDQGLIVYDGTVEQIKNILGKNRTVAVEFNEKHGEVNLPGVTLIQEKGHKNWYRFNKEQVEVSVLIQEITKQHNIVDLTIQEPEIESIIREIYQGGIHFDRKVSGSY